MDERTQRLNRLKDSLTRETGCEWSAFKNFLHCLIIIDKSETAELLEKLQPIRECFGLDEKTLLFAEARSKIAVPVHKGETVILISVKPPALGRVEMQQLAKDIHRAYGPCFEEIKGRVKLIQAKRHDPMVKALFEGLEELKHRASKTPTQL